VNYTGSYYGYYDEDGAQMFDTSLLANSDNDDYKKSFEFTPKTGSADTPISFTIGGTDSYLQMFKDAVIGLKAGESARVMIPPADGYGALTGEQVGIVGKTGNMNVHEKIKLDTFTGLYGISSIAGTMEVTSPYGWPAEVSPAGSQYVNVTHKPAVGSVYLMNGGVSLSVSSVSGASIAFEYVITFEKLSEEFVYPDVSVTDKFENVVLQKVIVNNEERYITAVSGDGLVFVTKNTDERTGMYLYFEITVVSITENTQQSLY